MKKFLLQFTLALFVLAPLFSIAQKELTLEEAVMGRRRNLAPERLSNINWIPNTNSYTYVEKNEGTQTLVMVDASSFSKTEIITKNKLSAQLLVKKAMTRIPTFHWLNKSEAYFVYTGMVFSFNTKTKEATKLYAVPKGAANIEFRPNSADMSYTKDNNLFAIIDGEEVQITNHTDPNIVAGQTVSRVEFGIVQGVIWSTSGKSLAFYEKDESKVTDYPLVDYTSRPAQLKNTKYPMAGMASEEVKIGIFNVGKKGVTYLKSENNIEDYLTSLSWGPNDKYIYAANLSRNQKELHLKQYNAQNGDFVKEILSEKNEKYVHPMHPMYFIGKEDFLWMSEKSGLNQFYFYNIGGNTNWHINTDDILVRSYVGYNEKSRKLWFMGNHKDKIDQHLFEVAITDGGNSEPIQITKGDAYHSYVWFNSNTKYAITKSSSLTIPTSYDLVELDNHSVSNLMTAENPLKDYKIGATRMGTIKADDGQTILHTRTIYPYDFDESKKYPVLIYVYNGPGVQLLHSSWLGSAPLWMHHFANKGYIVFTVDGRGSTNRGIEFEQATFRNLGQVEMKDQLAGLDYLKSLSYIDAKRVAVHGWSYGGFMTTSLLTSHPGLFKVGAAGGPVMDWKYYEVMYTERYMDTPEDNAEGYKLTSNLERAKDLKDKLLIIHGTVDPTVVKQHSDLFLKECIKHGVQVDYFEYPGHEHNVYGKDRVHLMQKILDYIEAYI
ncbi:DPP IV N-terminal domain-containing protein [bacterium SCSIO 12643]|nr:DPP IV N-terminal domain-containing protein [bacterium SCSIO 12643]